MMGTSFAKVDGKLRMIQTGLIHSIKLIHVRSQFATGMDQAVNMEHALHLRLVLVKLDGKSCGQKGLRNNKLALLV